MKEPTNTIAVGDLVELHTHDLLLGRVEEISGRKARVGGRWYWSQHLCAVPSPEEIEARKAETDTGRAALESVRRASADTEQVVLPQRLLRTFQRWGWSPSKPAGTRPGAGQPGQGGSSDADSVATT